jgi:hypothetical protein
MQDELVKTFKIRLYTAADLKAVLYIFDEAVHKSTVDDYSSVQRKAWAPEIKDEATWQSRFAQQQVGLLKALLPHRINGY